MHAVKSAIYVEPGVDLSVEAVESLPPGPRDVVVRVDASGVCHSDLSFIDGYLDVSPLILGHEGAGTVEWVGAQVSRVAVGQRVILSLVPTCGSCWHCRRGQEHLCELSMTVHGTQRACRANGTTVNALMGLGTFAESAVVHEASCVPVETDLPAEQLALLGCGMTTGLGAALNTAQVGPGDTVAVIGCGGVGAAVVQGASIAGAAQVIAIDPVAMKREQAGLLGATDAIDPTGADPVQQVHELTGGRGVDFAFEVVGEQSLVDQATQMTVSGGTTVLVGLPRSNDVAVSMPVLPMIRGDRTVKGSYFGSARPGRDFPRFVRLAEHGRIDLGSMITRRFPLDLVNDALRAMRDGSSVRSVLV
jgi:S-(hydroxymethyl)glutathione dehydrogenase/alcohol dehydrogenase